MLKMQHNTRHLLLNVAISECTSDAKPTLGYSLGSVAIPASFCFSRPLQGNQVIQLQNFRPPSRDGGG